MCNQNDSNKTSALEAIIVRLEQNDPNLTNLSFFRHDALSEHDCQALSKALKHDHTLRSLFLDGCNLSDYSIVVLTEALKTNTTLRNISFNYNDSIDREGILALGETLKANRSVESLSLKGCIIGDLGASVLGTVLKYNDTLKSLNLDNNAIDEGMSDFCEGIEHNPSLQALNLNNIHIGVDGAVLLGEALANNHNLRILSLDANEISNEGAVEFGKMLKKNKTLQSLSLNDNRIFIMGGLALGEGIKDNQSLQDLYLNDNQMGDDAASIFGKALQYNQSLKKLALNNAGISDHGVHSLSEALRCRDIGLRELTLDNNCITNEGAKVLAKDLAYNQSLKSLSLMRNYLGYSGIKALKNVSEAKRSKVILDVIVTDQIETHEF